MSKYLDESQLTYNFDYNAIKPRSSDSYNESKLKVIIDNAEENDRIELFSIALQFSIIGQTQQTGGSTEIDGSVVEIAELIENQNVCVSNEANEKIDEDVLTPKRLARIFRYEIKKFIDQTGTMSFLSTKYGDNQFVNETFPCAEYLITDIDSALHLISVYEKLDASLNTKFADRVRKVFKARNIE